MDNAPNWVHYLKDIVLIPKIQSFFYIFRSSSTSSSGVTIVKVGGNYGSKGELSYKTGSRHEISALRNAVASVRTNPTSEVTKTKIESRSTGRLPTHR